MVFFPTTVETVLVDEQAYSYSSDNRSCNTISANLVNLDEQRQSVRDLIGALTGLVEKVEADLDLGELIVDVYLLKTDIGIPSWSAEKPSII